MINISKQRLVLIIIAILGIAVRFNVYFQNRSLRIDEANLARNIVEKDYADFFKPLDYQQYAPPLFSATTKLLTRVFGTHEYSLKLLPFLGGVLSLVLLAQILNRVITIPPSRWYVLLLFAFSILAIRYGTEFKQYSTDATLSLFFILWTLKCKDRGFTPALSLSWALSGALAIWFSMPVIFILASIGLAFFYQAWNKNKANLKFVFCTSFFWFFSFGVYFFVLLYNDADTTALQDYHSPYFFDFFPTTKASLTQSLTLLESLFRLATDKTTISIIWAILTFTTGSVYLIKTKKLQAIILLAPILFCLLASHLNFYTLIERAILFMIPLIMVVIGIGLAVIWTKSNRALKVILLIPILISIVNKGGYQYFWEKLEMEDSKSVMRYLAEKNTAEEFIYVHHGGVPAFVFYNQMYDHAWGFQNYYLATWNEKPEGIIPGKVKSSSNDHFWLFFSHTNQEGVEENLSSTANFAVETEQYRSVEASVYRYRVE